MISLYMYNFNNIQPLMTRFLGRPQGMTLCLHDRLCVCQSVCLSVRQHFGIHFF